MIEEANAVRDSESDPNEEDGLSPPGKGRRSGKNYHRDCTEVLRRLAEPLKPLQRKELARGSNPPGLNEPFDCDLVTQLATIPARISMYDLLRLSPETIRQ